MPTPVWTPISDFRIAIDGFGTAFLQRLYRDNADHLKGVIDGAVDAPKVPAQVFALETSGSGNGLVGRMWNNKSFTVVPTVVGSATTVELDSGVFADAAYEPRFFLKVSAGSSYIVEHKVVEKPGGASGKYFLQLINTGAGSATVEGRVLFFAL